MDALEKICNYFFGVAGNENKMHNNEEKERLQRKDEVIEIEKEREREFGIFHLSQEKQLNLF